MVGRLFWVLARDDATPFSRYFSQVNERLSCPIPATILCAVLCTAVGAIQLGSTTAFNSLVGSFIILTTGSYLLAILPHLLTKRKNTPKGPFWMGDLGFAVNGIACVLIVFFNIFFCFPYAYPVAPISAMNCKSFLSLDIVPTANKIKGNSVIFVGLSSLTALWWMLGLGKNYSGPKLTEIYANN
jgi:choline transport protein